MSPADLADYADKTQNHNNITNCLSLRYNAACCIPLRDLRYLRENTRKSTQSIYTEETPMSPADLADNRRRTTKTTIISPPSQTVFLCEIMQPAAFLCDLCAICERICRSCM